MSKNIFKGSVVLNPVPVVMVTSRNNEGKDNVFTVAWTGTVCTKPPMLSISIRPERLSYEYIKESMEFTINLPTRKLTRETDFCGVRSGRVKEARSFIGQGQMAIEFTNRKLSELEENVLIDLIKSNSDLNITYVFSENSGDSEKIKFVKAVTEEGFTKFYRGTLRSGNKLEYDGNIVVIGDVNPGAVIRAILNPLFLSTLLVSKIFFCIGSAIRLLS